MYPLHEEKLEKVIAKVQFSERMFLGSGRAGEHGRWSFLSPRLQPLIAEKR